MNGLVRKARKAAHLLKEPAWRRALLSGTAASIEHDRLPLTLAYKTVIDVGANRGQFALYARTRFPDSRVYSFEPLQEARTSLERLFRCDGKVRVIAAAAGSKEETASIHVTRRDDSSSLLSPTPWQTRSFPGTDVARTEQIEVKTLDSVFEGLELECPVLLKLDVQGFELEVLRGARRLLGRVDTVLTECSFVPFYEGQALFDAVSAYLKDADFGLIGGEISKSSGRRWEQGDFVFEKDREAVRQQHSV